MASELVYDFADQNTPEWLAARLGVPTASAFADILASGRGGGESKTRKTYLYKLAAERLTGQPREGFQNAAMQRGHDLEPEARDTFAAMMGLSGSPVALAQVGFVFCPDARAGASPDALVDEDATLEIKTREPHLQLALLDDGGLPPEHKAQVQGQLWITRRTRAHYFSYSPNVQPFHLIVERDEPFIAHLAASVAQFNADLDAMVERFQKGV